MSLPHLRPDDLLGRGVFSKRQKRRFEKAEAEGGRVAKGDVFEPPKGGNTVSVDRLGFAPDEEMVEIAETVSTRDKRFQGWAVVSVQKARENRREVKATPELTNRYHAEIIFPQFEQGREERDQQINHALELASSSEWRPRP